MIVNEVWNPGRNNMKHLFKLTAVRILENWDYVWAHRFDYLTEAEMAEGEGKTL